MANETTSTSQTALIATEVLAADSIRANLPKFVFLQLCHHDSIDGLGTLQKRYHVESDLGAATGATEGTDITANTELGMGTSVTKAPTEGVGIKALITDKTVRRRLGGTPFRTVRDAFMRGSLDQVKALLAPDVRRFTAMAFEKVENDALANLASLTNSVGTTNTVLSFTTLLQSLFTMKTLEPLKEDWAYLLAPVGIHHLTLEALVTSGGLGGALWNTGTVDASFMGQPADPTMNGFRGSFLRRPVFEYGHSVRPTANSGTDVVQAIFSRGSPQTPPDSFSLGGKVGAFNFLEGHPLDFQTEPDASFRAVELVMTWEYIHHILVQDGVKIISRNS